MPYKSIRLIVACTVVIAVALGGFVGSVAAAEEEVEEECPCVSPEPDPIKVANPAGDDEAPMNEVAVKKIAVQNPFLQAKRAHHTARQNIQAIKKGNEEAREEVPTFFESEGDDEES